MTRQQAGDRLLEMARAHDRLLVGLDFAFSLPAWYLDEQGIDTAADLWADGDRLERWLGDCQPPFWGRPGRRRPERRHPEQTHWRRTELAVTPRPKSVFQIGGAGAVGTASLRGMPVLARLYKEGFPIWPFQPAGEKTVLEVWPRLATGPMVKSSPAARQLWLDDPARKAAIPAPFSTYCQASADAFDATAAALALLDSPPPPDLADPTIRREGWIWDPARPIGVPSGHAEPR